MATLRLGSKVICPIKVKAPATTVLSITPTTSQQIITPTTDPFSKVLVSDVNASIDSNIIGSNIRAGVQILDVVGTYELPQPAIKINRVLSLNGTLTTGEGFIDLSDAVIIPDYGLYEAYAYASGLTGNIDLSNINTIGLGGLYRTFYRTNISSLDLSGITSITNNTALRETCCQATNLTNLNLSNLQQVSSAQGLYGIASDTAITKVDLSILTTISGENALYAAFKNCTSLTEVRLDSLSSITGYSAMCQAFKGCTSLTTLMFPSLQISAFGSNTNQFDEMLSGVTGCIVHFPSDLESIIGNWTSVLNGFGGTNTVVLFDLPACIRDSSLDLVWNSEEGRYEPATNA